MPQKQLGSGVPAKPLATLSLAIELAVRDTQFVDNASIDNRFFDDAGHVGKLHFPIPDGLRIDHDGGPELTLIETTSGIGPDERLKATAFDFFFEGVAKGFAAVGIATAASVARLAAVGADEDVMGEFRHGQRPSTIGC